MTLGRSSVLRTETCLPTGGYRDNFGVILAQAVSAFLSCRMISLKPVVGKMPLILPQSPCSTGRGGRGVRGQSSLQIKPQLSYKMNTALGVY